MTCPQTYRAQMPVRYDDRFLDCEHDDLMDADDYDARRAQRDGWQTGAWDGRW
jgi:hypothetical protein